MGSTGGSSETIGSQIRPLLVGYMKDLGYEPPQDLAISSTDAVLWKGMCDYADRSGIPYDEGTFSWKCFIFGATYASWCFPDHRPAAKVYTGLYTWLAIMLDDVVSRPEHFADGQRFLERYCKHEAQPSPLFEAWADMCRLAYEHFDPIVANLIVTSSLNFVTANVLEARSEFGRIQPTAGGAGASWPWYLRTLDGVAEAYGYLTWPQDQYPDISCFMEMIPDLIKWICWTNDIFSFYKESLAGETDNYIHNRTRYSSSFSSSSSSSSSSSPPSPTSPSCSETTTQQDSNNTAQVLQTLSEIIDEAKAAATRMELVLCAKGRECYAEAIHKFINGYMGFHIKNGRYRLWELGLTEPDRVIQFEQQLELGGTRV